VRQNLNVLRMDIDIAGFLTGFIRVPGGLFFMGSNFDRDDQWPMVRVQLDDFYLSAFVVTQELFEAVMGFNHSQFRGLRLPVTNVSHDEANDFCFALSSMFPGKTFRLPTEAEWERAATSGSRYRYAGSDNIDEVAWYHGNSNNRPQAVGLKKPNAIGLYDMSGNVWEWCSDVYSTKYAGCPWPISPVLKNPTGRLSVGNNKVLRGGCFLFHKEVCAVRSRSRRPPSGRASYVGFRVVMED
jgi:formylglycine-generating enzyme required for sulfatase activity